MSGLSVRHTADLSAGELAELRSLLDRAFEGRFDDADWQHTLGGLHVRVHEGDRLVGHAGVVQRQMLVGDRPLRAGYVEAVAVEATDRGRGHGAAVMAECERIVRAAYEIGGLSAGDQVAEFYLGRGWLRWAGSTAVLAPAGLTRTPEEDRTTYVLPVVELADLTGVLACDWRAGDVW